MTIQIPEDPSREVPPDLSRLDIAIRLKTDLIHRMAASSARQWPQHLSEFVTAVGNSGLQNTSALLVLLVEVRQELRARAGLGTPANSDLVQLFDLAQNPHPSVNQILSRFQQVVMNDLQVAVGSITMPEVVIQAMRFIEDHYGQPITVARVATAVGRSPQHLSTLFRQHAGTTVHEYLVRVRLRRAIHLICNGEKIEAVSLLVGYRSKKNFYRHFRSHTGRTPSTYRTGMKIERTKQSRVRDP
jgi:AraC-like DNA-binding protein